MKIGSDQNLMCECFNRATALAPAENVIVITTSDLTDMCRRELRDLPEQNIISEPARRDTAAAVGLAAVQVAARDPDGVMVVLPADQLIRPVEKFARVLKAAAQVADERRCIVTTGIVPRGPATGYGYIQRGEPIGEYNGVKAFEQITFKEKPDQETAQEYVRRGDHYWNSGIFTWRADVILEAFKKHAPDHAQKLERIRKAIGGADEQQVLEQAYGELQKISVDYAIMENVTDVVTVEADFNWDDVGSWTAVADHMDKDAEGNAVEGEFAGLDSRNNVVLGRPGRLVAAVGMSDMVVVDDGDVIFICPRDRDQEVKTLVQELRERGQENKL
jgi:mannose-1-phosphate guanylyltransferase